MDAGQSNKTIVSHAPMKSHGSWGIYLVHTSHYRYTLHSSDINWADPYQLRPRLGFLRIRMALPDLKLEFIKPYFYSTQVIDKAHGIVCFCAKSSLRVMGPNFGCKKYNTSNFF